MKARSKYTNAMVDDVVLCHTCQQSLKACSCAHACVAEGSDAPLVALYEGVVHIGDAPFRCYVLNNQQRVFNADDVAAFFGGEVLPE